MATGAIITAGIFALSCTGQSDFEVANYSSYTRSWVRSGPTYNKHSTSYVIDFGKETWCSGKSPCGSSAKPILGVDPDGFWVLEEHTLDSKGGRWRHTVSKDGRRYKDFSGENNRETISDYHASGTCTLTQLDAKPPPRPTPRPVRPVGDQWTGTRWSGFEDCSRNLITLSEGGKLSMSTGATGTWRGGQYSLSATIGTNWSALLERDGDFRIADKGSKAAGSEWVQCDAVADRPYLPMWWIEGQRWSGYSDCKLVMIFERNGVLALSNGQTATWALSASQLKLNVGENPLILVRQGERLVDKRNGGAFTRCN